MASAATLSGPPAAQFTFFLLLLLGPPELSWSPWRNRYRQEALGLMLSLSLHHLEGSSHLRTYTVGVTYTLIHPELEAQSRVTHYDI